MQKLLKTGPPIQLTKGGTRKASDDYFLCFANHSKIISVGMVIPP